jgi:hypothetical protein
MPRSVAKLRKKWVEGTHVIDPELESTLVFGESFFGVCRELRSVEDWRRHWARWRSLLEPKVAEHLAGFRAFAAYVCGEIPDRPVLQEPPLSNRYFKLYVPSANGSGQWHYRYPPPFMQNEPQWLRELGLIGNAEWQRYREARMKNPIHGSPYGELGYPLEMGCYS